MGVKMKKYYFIFLFSLSLIHTTICFAQTEVSEKITVDTTWTKSNSPYIVTGTVNIYPGATLTIEPGVVVKLDSSISIQIGGELIARGTETDSIYFIQSEQGTRWENIRFIDSSVDAAYDDEGNYISGSIIEYARIEGAGNSGIYLVNASPLISRNTISGNTTTQLGCGGGIYCLQSSPLISKNTISHDTSFYHGGGIYGDESSPTISENKISFNKAYYSGGAVYSSGGSPKILKNIISNNKAVDNGGGINIFWKGKSFFPAPNISNNVITYNEALKGGGIYTDCWDFDLAIYANEIKSNTATLNGGGIYLNSVPPNINYNNIFNNTLFDTYPEVIFDVDAKNNWWGTTDKDSISAHIYDYWDDITLGKVYYEPFLSSATPINISSITLKTDNTYFTNLTTLSILDTLYIELTATDGDETNQDTTAAYVINESKTDSISVKLIETSLNTGIYRGIAYFSAESDDTLDVIGAEKEDNIKIVSPADTDVYKEFLSIVPVELYLFNANVENNNNVILYWNTKSETNNYGFEIHRSINKVKFEKVGFVIGNGTTSEMKSYIFTDKNVNSGTHYYRLKQTDFDGSYYFSDIIKIEINSPKEFSLHQNYPNPFNPETTIKYQLPEKSFITLKIYNIHGQEIKILINDEKPAGYHSINWDATNNYGTKVSSGIYIYQLNAGHFIQTKNMILLK